MKTFTKLLLAGGAALLLTACQSLTEPDGFKFVVGASNPLSVRLESADQTPVTGARLFLERRALTGPKSQNLIQEVPLRAAGDGSFTIDGDHGGERLSLAARLPDGSVIHGRIDVP